MLLRAAVFADQHPSSSRRSELRSGWALTMRQLAWFCLYFSSALAEELVAPTRNYVDGECVEGFDPELHGDIDFFPHHAVDRRSVSRAFEFRGKVKADYSLHWDVTYHGTYKLLENKLRGATYVLWQCGTPKPEVEGAAGYYEVPVTKIGITSTTYMPYVEIVGERNALKAYTSTFSYVSSPCLQRLYRDGYIREGFNSTTGAINIRADEVDVVIADEWTVDRVPNGYSITDTHEDTVFQVAEYVEVVGLFFNREHEATLALDQILDAYTCLREDIQAKDLTKSGQQKKKVVMASYVALANAFSITSCPNWYCEVIEDAGGELVEFQGEGEVELWGYKFMSLDQLATLAADADVYVSDGPLSDHYAQQGDDVSHEIGEIIMETFSIPVFDNQGRLGHNDWWERRLAEPDAVLADFAAMLWPDVYPSENRNFFRDLRAGEPPGSKIPLEGVDAVCPNPDAPFQWLISAASECLEERSTPFGPKDNNKKSSRSNVALTVGLAVALAVVILAMLIFLFVGHVRRRRRNQNEMKAQAELVATLEDQKYDENENFAKNPTLA